MPVLATLSLVDADQHPVAVDIADLQVGHFVHAQPAAISHAEGRAISQPRGLIRLGAESYHRAFPTFAARRMDW